MLVVRNLSVAAPGAEGPPLLDGFALDLGPGEWVAFSGPNGCGKTTLALALAGLRRARGGTIELDGQPLGPGGPACSSVAAVLQEPASQLLQSTVRGELGFTARNLGVDEVEVERRIARRSAMLGLESDLDRPPLELSAGRQQLVLIAAALVAEPRVLVLDEAGAHLDGDARARVLAAIQAEVRTGRSVLWVTQVPEELAAADRVVGLEGAAFADLGHGSRSERDAPLGPADLAGATPARLFRIEIDPWAGQEGPRIEVAVPMVFEVRTGVTAITGRNGIGKSVLLAATAGMLVLPQVRVSRPGEGPGPLLASQYPEQQLFEERVEDELAYAAVARGLEREATLRRAADCCAELGFGPGLLERRTWDLSSGEKRLLHLISALIAPASLLLLDEPTCGLDARRRSALAGMVARRGRWGRVLVASQDRAWLDRIGARVEELSGIAPETASYGKNSD